MLNLRNLKYKIILIQSKSFKSIVRRDRSLFIVILFTSIVFFFNYQFNNYVNSGPITNKHSQIVEKVLLPACVHNESLLSEFLIYFYFVKIFFLMNILNFLSG